MATFAEFEAATRMRDLIKTLVREEMEATRPVYTYATVVSIDRVARRCTVVFPDSADPVSVQMGAIQPKEPGQVVRVDGIVGDRYIDEVLGSGFFTISEITSGNYVPGVSGFDLNEDGSAELNDVTIRGDIVADSFQTSGGSNRIEVGVDYGGAGDAVIFFLGGSARGGIFGIPAGGVGMRGQSGGSWTNNYVQVEEDSVFVGATDLIQMVADRITIVSGGGDMIIDNTPTVRASSLSGVSGGWSKGTALRMTAGYQSTGFSVGAGTLNYGDSFSSVLAVIAVQGGSSPDPYTIISTSSYGSSSCSVFAYRQNPSTNVPEAISGTRPISFIVIGT